MMQTYFGMLVVLAAMIGAKGGLNPWAMVTVLAIGGGMIYSA